MCLIAFLSQLINPNKEHPSLRYPFLYHKIAKLEIVCNKEDENTIVKIIKEHARKGKSYDGLFYVTNVV